MDLNNTFTGTFKSFNFYLIITDIVMLIKYKTSTWCFGGDYFKNKIKAVVNVQQIKKTSCRKKWKMRE